MNTNINKSLLNEFWTSVSIDWENHGRRVSQIYYEYDSDTIDGYDEQYLTEEGITPEIFEATKDYFENLIYTAKYYEDGSTIYLQLHDNYTLWDIDNTYLDDYDYDYLVDSFVSAFEEQTGVDLYLLGRSGRHVCVEFNLDNLLNYENLVNLALTMEKELIAQANDTSIYGPEED